MEAGSLLRVRLAMSFIEDGWRLEMSNNDPKPCIRRDGTPMSEEERLYKEAVFARIKQDLYEGLRKKDEKAAKPKVEATVLEFPPKLSEQELIRRQQIIDQTWERVVEQRRELERLAERSCHRGPGDSDWNL
jgi:hypothetical protein